MNSNYNWDRVTELFEEASDLPPKQWDEFLTSRCTLEELEAGLHNYVQTLLENSLQANAWFDSLDNKLSTELSSGNDQFPYAPGYQFGKFRITAELGQGGMASVFLCERADGQFDQKVAIKIMKIRENRDFFRERFRQEQQILAAINHPNIAQLYDGGITEDGFPYIVMEYIEGKSIVDYCHSRKLTARERIALFVQVCNAVQYAHSRLIVHHDIKPANILVNNQGQVKLLDFGISQVLINQMDSQNTPRSNSFEGTLMYAAPEQLSGAEPSVSSDIYKMGLVLYELMTGLNFNFKTDKPDFIIPVKQNPAFDILFSGHREIGSRKIILEDIDCVLKKSLATDPAERFESVSNMGHDLKNILENRLLHSHPHTPRYRLHKQYLRNKKAVWIIAAFNVALIVSFTLLAIQYFQTVREKERSENILGFVWGIFDAADPEVNRGDTISVYQLMEKSIPRIETLAAEPILQSELFHISGQIYSKLGFWKKGNELFEQALDVHNAKVAGRKNMVKRATLLADIAHFHRNNSSPDLADSIIDVSISLFERHGNRRSYDKFSGALNTKARILNDKGLYKESLVYSQRASDIMRRFTSGPHIEKIRANTIAAMALNQLSDYSPAITLIEEALQMAQKLNEYANSTVLMAYSTYSRLLANTGELQAAIENDYRIYNIQLSVYGPDKPVTLVTLSNIASKYYRMKDYHKSDSINLIALEKYISQFGEYHNFTATTLLNLANSSYSQQRYDEARSYLLRSMAIDRYNLGDTHPYLAGPYQTIGLIYYHEENWSKALENLNRSLHILKSSFGEKHRQVSSVYENMGDIYLKMNDKQKSMTYYEMALEIATDILGEDHSDTKELKEKFLLNQSL